MSTLLKLLLTLLLTATAHGATAVVGGLRVNADSSNTNTTSVRVTVSGTTNLNSGVLNATNSVNVGVGGTAAGVLTLRSTNATYAIDQTVTNDGTYVVRYGTTNMLTLAVGSGAGWTGTGTNFLADDGTFKQGGGDSLWEEDGTNLIPTDTNKEFALTDADELLIGSIPDFGMLYLAGGANFAQVFGGGVPGVLTHFDLYADDDAISLKLFDASGVLRTALDPMEPDNPTNSAFLFTATTNWTTTNLVFRVEDDGGTPLFGITGESGWTGAGTKSFFDDGTYKTAVTASSTTAFTNKDLTDASNTLPGQIGAACSDETTALATGTGKVTFRMPVAATLTAVRASLTTAQTSGSIFTVDINENGTTVLSTKLTIDNGEKTSTTAATPPVISDSALADDSEITVDIDQVGDGTATGLKVWLIYTY